MPRDAVSRTANVERNGGKKWVNSSLGLLLLDLLAVRETGVSRHHGGTIESPPETSRTSQHNRIEGIKGVPNLRGH